MSRKKTERKYSSCLFGLYLYRSQLYIFPKFCCTSFFLAGMPSLSRFLILMALAAKWKGSGLSVHVGGHLLTPVLACHFSLYPIEQMGPGELSSYQKPVSGSAPQTGKKWEVGTPDMGGSAAQVFRFWSQTEATPQYCYSLPVRSWGKLACINLFSFLWNRVKNRIYFIARGEEWLGRSW